GLHLAAHGADLRGAGDERRRGRRGALGLDLDLDVGVFLTEALGPQGHQVGQSVRADGREVARDAAGLLVARDRRVDLAGLGEEAAPAEDTPAESQGYG